MASSREFGSLRHLAGRFFGSLLAVGPSAADERWARDHLLPGEQALWQRMSGADRRHAVDVARRTLAYLGGPAGETAVGREVTAAALLHDVGKIEAGISTWGRAAVTAMAMAVGRDRLLAWSEAMTPGRWRRRIGSYLGHDRVGADLLAQASADPFTVVWAAEHHRPPQRWSVEARLGEALKLADDD